MSQYDNLIAILCDAQKLLAKPGNDFFYSFWTDAKQAIAEIDEQIAMLRQNAPRDSLNLKILFAPTGPIQEVSTSSGWGDKFLELANQFDEEMRKAGLSE